MNRHIEKGMWLAGLVALAAIPLGCGPSAAAQAAIASLPGHLQVGGHLVLYAPPGASCPTTFATSEEELALGGKPLHTRGDVDSPLGVTVVETKVEGSDVLVTVTRGPQQFLHLKVPSGQYSQCLWSDPAPYQAALKKIGSSLAFTPWKPTCTELHAVGEGASSVLVEADPVVSFELTGVELGPETAEERAEGSGGPSIWYALGDGALQVRADVLDACFTEQGDGTAPPPSFAALLATPVERCKSDGPDGVHVVCRTSLGVWEGQATNRYVALRRVHRTLGTVHFYDEHPADGSLLAHTVVGIEKVATSSEQAAKVLSLVEASVDQAMKVAAEDAVRLVGPKEPEVTHHLRIDVSASVGPLKRRQISETSRYKKGERTVTNPKRQPAEERVTQAEQRLKEEEKSYEENSQLFEEAKQKALDECHEQANNASEEQQGFLNLSCDVGGLAIGIVEPTRDGINSAQQELNEARSNLGNTPKTLQEDIMDTWTYQKTVLSRSSKAEVRVTLKGKRGTQPQEVTIPVTHRWEDYQVTADEYHNVEGHEPDSAPIDDPETLLDPLAQKLTAPLAGRLQAWIMYASLDGAMKAFRDAGKAEAKPGYEIVDAVAYEIAGDRIKKLALRGKSSLRAKSPTVLPSGNASVAGDECLLAVAAVPLETSGWQELQLATQTASHVDSRRRPVVSFEICGYEVTTLPKAQVSATKDTQVLWALYVAAGGNADGLTAPGTKASAAPAAAAIAKRGTPAAAPAATGAAPAPAAKPMVDESMLGGPGESCQRRADCKRGLRCVAQVCRH